jgi:hypothetical protein
MQYGKGVLTDVRNTVNALLHVYQLQQSRQSPQP